MRHSFPMSAVTIRLWSCRISVEAPCVPCLSMRRCSTAGTRLPSSLPTAPQPQQTQSRVVQRGTSSTGAVAAHHNNQRKQAAAELMQYRRTVAKKARRQFLKHVHVETKVAFPIPSVMDSASFVAFLKTRTRRLMELLVAFQYQGPGDAVRDDDGGGVPQSNQRQRRHQRTMQMKAWEERLAPLLTVREKDVEVFVWEGKERLKSKLMATCLVPYRLAVNFILARLPPELRAASIQQLQAAEQRTAASTEEEKPPFDHNGVVDGGVHDATTAAVGIGFTILKWVEADVYGNRMLMRLGTPRIPVFVLLGHARSGKTSLLGNMLQDPQPGGHDPSGGGGEQQMQGSSLFVDLEGDGARRRTEALRAVTVSLSSIGRPSDAALIKALSDGGTASQPCPQLTSRCGDAPSSGKPSHEEKCGNGTAQETPAAAGPGDLYPERVSLIDTPGHRIFSEMRLHTIVASDTVLLVVGLDEGVQAQTREAVVVALNVDRPVIVIFNKLDVFTDEVSGAKALKTAMADLAAVGLDVSLCASEDDLEAILVGHPRGTRTQNKTAAGCGPDPAGDRTSKSPPFSNRRERQHNDWRYFACRQGEVDPNYVGSMRRPVLNVRRRALGVCVSATRRWNFHLVAAAMRWTVALHPPRAVCDKSLGTSQPCGVQAVVLEASKQAYDVEGSAVSPARRAMESKHLTKKKRRAQRYQDRGGSVKARAMQAQRYYAYGRGAHSSSQENQNLILTVLVRSGVLTVGTAFVADQCVGIVERMVDYFGCPVREAVPGMVVTVMDAHARTGCPGAGIHLLSLPTYPQACRVFEYRRLLQWYVEVFSKKTQLLRPRGMSCTFAHLGIYAQEDPALLHTLGMQLLYGPPPPPAEAATTGPTPTVLQANGGGGGADSDRLAASDASAASLAEGSKHGGARSVQQEHMPTTQAEVDALGCGGIGKFLQDQATLALHEEEAAFLSTTTSLAGEAIPSTTEANSSRDAAALLHANWLALQPSAASGGGVALSEKEWIAMQSQKTQVGVMVKVDSWHTARILYREVHKLGTSRIALHVLVARFGRMTVDDYMVASGAVKVVLCYRTPRAESVALEKHLAIHNVKFMECDAMVDAMLFLKRCAVELHMELFGGDDERATRGHDGGSALRGRLRGTPATADDRRRHRQTVNGEAADSSSDDHAPEEKVKVKGADAYLGSLLEAAVGISPLKDATLRRRQRLTTRRTEPMATS